MFLSTFDPFRSLERSTSWAPAPRLPMDAIRRDDEVEIRLDVPGVSLDDLDITVERNILTVVAERPAPAVDRADVLARERRSGRISRQIALADTLDGGRVVADLTDGVLTLTIPVAETSKTQKVEVSVGSPTPAIEASADES